MEGGGGGEKRGGKGVVGDWVHMTRQMSTLTD